MSDPRLGPDSDFLGEQRIKLICDFLWCHSRFKASYYLSISVNQELGEVPTDIGFSVGIGLLGFKYVVQVTGSIPIYLYFREQLEIAIVFASCKFKNFVVVTRLLRSKLIARKAKNL